MVARYAPGQPQDAAQQIAAAGGQIDALFIPDQADGMPAVASALAATGVKTQILGTGVWNDARVLRLPQLQGAWFAAPDSAGFSALAQRYKAKFGSEPTRLATPLLRRRDAGRGAGARRRSRSVRHAALTNVPASTAPTACSASAPTEPTSAASP